MITQQMGIPCHILLLLNKLIFKNCKKLEGEKCMNKIITKEQINTAIALALMKYLYNKGEISEKVYKKIIHQYGGKGIANNNEVC